jgi:RND family efflux transporter MFP subunit
MSMTKRIAALAAGCLFLLSVAALAQSGGLSPDGGGGSQAYEPLVLEVSHIIGPRLEWFEKSDVAALREGVIEQMELKIGMQVKKGGTIGTLHHEIAELTVKKNQLQAEQVSPKEKAEALKEKAEAQKEVAISVVARNKRLNERLPGTVSAEDVAKAEGELKVAEGERKVGQAQILEAVENRKIAEAELHLAEQTLKEHTIVAPFEGIIINRYKNPGESVRANEKVVVLANPYKVCVDPYVPLKYVHRVKVGQVVEIQQIDVDQSPEIEHGNPEKKETKSHDDPLVFEKKKYRGKITFVSPEVQTVGETGVRVRAEFDNPDLELRPGFLARVTIFVPAVVATSNVTGDPTTRTTRTE